MAATTHIKRDAPESSDASKIIDNTLGSIKSGIEDTFTKENLSVRSKKLIYLNPQISNMLFFNLEIRGHPLRNWRQA
jgi:hypothetical protein